MRLQRRPSRTILPRRASQSPAARSVSVWPGRTAASATSSRPGIAATPVAMTTTSAAATAWARSVVVSVAAPSRFAAASDAADRPTPITRPARLRARKARPIEPPIRPTPTIVTTGQCGFVAAAGMPGF